MYDYINCVPSCFFSCSLTFLLVEDQLGLELPPVVQGSLDLSRRPVAGLGAVQEVAGAALLHELGSGVTRELAEAVGAVDDGVERLHLGVTQNEVTVWKERGEKNNQWTSSLEPDLSGLLSTFYILITSAGVNTFFISSSLCLLVKLSRTSIANSA